MINVYISNNLPFSNLKSPEELPYTLHISKGLVNLFGYHVKIYTSSYPFLQSEQMIIQSLNPCASNNTMQSYRLFRLTQPSHNMWDCNCK